MSSDRSMALKTLIAATLISWLGLTGCVYYPPYYQAPVDPVVVSWQAARSAMQDIGFSVVTADEASGVLVGRRGNAEGTIIVRMRSDGRVGVEITSRDPDRTDPGLTDRLTDAYNRRMGR